MNEKIIQNSLENSENSATGSGILQNSSNLQTNKEQKPLKEAKSIENDGKGADFTEKAAKNSNNSRKSVENGCYSSKNSENSLESSNSSENNAISSKNREKSLDLSNSRGNGLDSSKIEPNLAKGEERSSKSIENGEGSPNYKANPVNTSDFFNSDSERELKASFPTVEVENLRNSKEFNQLLELVIKNPTLAQIYSCFNSIVSSAEENSRLKLASALAAAESGVGSLASSAPSEKAFFTRDEVLRMSQEEIKKNYTKIRQSQQLW